jgi:glutathione S-transferase
MIKVWGRANSVNVQKVVWACVEAGVDFERIDAGGAFGLVDEPWYLDLNPNGRVPVIDDDGFVLWESNVIVRYLASKYAAAELCPQDLEGRALAEQWMEWEQTAILPALTPVFWGLVRTAPEDRDWGAIESGRAAAVQLWGILDAWLEERAYVAGEEFSMADIPLGAGIHRWLALEIERPRMRHLEDWHQRLSTRQGYRDHVALPLT